MIQRQAALPPFKIIDAADALLSVLNDFGEKEGECRTRDLGGAGLVEGSVVDIGAIESGLGREAGGGGMVGGGLGGGGEDGKAGMWLGVGHECLSYLNELSAARIASAVCARPAEPPLPRLSARQNGRRRPAHPRLVARRL